MNLRRWKAKVARWAKPHAEWIVFGHSLHRSRRARRTTSQAVYVGKVGRLLLGVAMMLAVSSCSTIGTAISCTVAHGCVTR